MASSRWATQIQVIRYFLKCPTTGRPLRTPPELPGPLPENAEFWCLPRCPSRAKKREKKHPAPCSIPGASWPPRPLWPPLAPPPGRPWPSTAPWSPPKPPNPPKVCCAPPYQLPSPMLPIVCTPLRRLQWWELRATALNPKRQWFGWWPVKAHSGRENKPGTDENCWTALQTNAFA